MPAALAAQLDSPAAIMGESQLRWLTAAIAFLWLGALGAYLWGFFGPSLFAPQPFGVTLGILAIAIVPILLAAVLVEMAIQGRSLARTNRTLARLATGELGGAGDGRLGTAPGAVRRELDKLSGALDSTLARVAAIETMIENQVGAVERAGGRAQMRAQAIRDLLQQERDRLEAVVHDMSANASAIVQAVSTEAGRVRQANEIAAREIREAEGLLSRQMESFRALAEDSGHAVHARVEAIEAAAEKLQAVVDDSLKAADALTLKANDQHAALSASAARLNEERARLEQALQAQDRLIAKVAGNASGLAETLETAVQSVSTRVGQTLTLVETRSTEAGRSLRAEVDAATEAGQAAAEAISQAASAARDAAAGMREAVASEVAALGQSLGQGMHALDDVARSVGNTLSDASENAHVLVNSLEDTIRTVESASARLFGLLEQMGSQTTTAQNAVDNASLAMEQRLGQIPEMAADHAARLSALLEDQAHRMGALADSLTRRVQASAPTLAGGGTPSEDTALAPPPAFVSPAPPAPAAEPAHEEPPSKTEDTVFQDEPAPPTPIPLPRPARLTVRPAEDESAPRESGLGAITRFGKRLRRVATPHKGVFAEDPGAQDNIFSGPTASAAGEAGMSGAGAETTGFWSTLFARIDGGDPNAPLVPRGAEATPSNDELPSSETRTQYTLETLYALAIDLDRLLEEDPPIDLWKRYRNGEAEAFARRLLGLQTAGLEHRIRHKFRDDGEFREHVNRYRERFQEIVEAISPTQSAGLFATPAGRLYLLLEEALRSLG